VIVKPAPATPLCAYKLQKFFFEARLPKEALTVVNADVPQIEQLASSPKIAYVTFIGSAKVGWNLRKIIAPGTRLNLEHGGLAPALVREDADVDAAVSALVKGAFYHSGQVCISTQRVYVHETVYQEFRQKFLAATEALVMGDATHEQTDVGPLIRSAEVTRIQDWISDAVSRGARVLCGNTVEGKGQYLRPTILDNVSADARLMLDEVFGPVVCLNSYRDEKAVIDHLNSGEYLFQACMFTSNIQHALRLAKQIKTMTIAINEHNAYRVDWTPFGGHRRSGLGMSGVKYLIEEMTQLKQIIFKY
jgi:acyl-CoA reductase-like NAD-dependent aldehyde dehydrogenase